MKVTTIRSRFRIKRRSYTQFLFLSVLAISYFSGVSAAPSGTEYEVCDTEKCNELAKELLSSMNMTINPCNDFHGYVCGKWAKEHPIPAAEFKWTPLGIVRNRTHHRVKEILESVPMDGENTLIVKAKQAYRACMDTNAIENEGVTVLMKYINQTGGWPIIMSDREWKNSRKPWQIVESEYRVIVSSSIIINLKVGPDTEHFSDKHVLEVLPTPLTIRYVSLEKNSDNLDDFFTKPDIAENIKYITDIAGHLARQRKFEIDENEVKKDVQGIVLFQSRLAGILAQADEVKHEEIKGDGKRLQPNTTIAEFQEFYDSWARNKTSRGQIDWLKRIQEFFAPTNSVTIDSSQTIIVRKENYFKLLSGLLDRTPERDIVNAIHWHFLEQTVRHVDKETLTIVKKYRTAIVREAKNESLPSPRWWDCIAFTDLVHPQAFAYVQQYFSDAAKNEVLKMVKEIKSEMGKKISRSEWLDDDSKLATKEKLDHLDTFIGYPDWYKDPTAVDERYKELSIGSSFFENLLLIKQFNRQEKLKLLGKPVDKNTWSISPIKVDASYPEEENSLTLPAGILQTPFFDTEFPDAINYGGLGYIAGYLMSHGFDNFGSTFDKDGKAKNLWTNETIEKFQNKSKCLVNQFNENGGNGSITINEDIDDNTGIKIAFEALRTRMKSSHYRDMRLPGLENFTAEHLYFLSFAGILCESERPEFRSIFGYGDRSSLPLRIRGLSNSEAFSKAFKCPKDSPMNPLKKCSIWH